MNDECKTVVNPTSFRLTAEALELLDRLAEEDRRPKNRTIQVLIEQEIARRNKAACPCQQEVAS